VVHHSVRASVDWTHYHWMPRILCYNLRRAQTAKPCNITKIFTSSMLLQYGTHIKYSLSSQVLEKVQTRTTKVISNLRNKSYEERFRILKLPTLIKPTENKR